MRHPAIELKNLPAEENFAIAVLHKQKECLETWLDYLNAKNVSLPEEREKYKLRISQINDAIKTLEDESMSADMLPLKKSKNSKAKKYVRKSNRQSNSTTDSIITNTSINQTENMAATFSAEFISSDN